MVLIYHYFVLHAETQVGSLAAYLQKYMHLTFAGVDIFFVLSGFLLGGVLLDQRRAGNVFRIFYLRRALRILPPYVLFLILFAVALVLGPSTGHPVTGWLLDDPFPFWSYGLNVQNFFMAAEGRFGPHFAGITWSLAVEEQFYLLFPLFVYWCSPRFFPAVVIALACAAPVLRGVLYFLAPEGGVAGFVLLPSRWDSLFLGVLAAWAIRSNGARLWANEHEALLRGAFVISVAGVALLPVIRATQFSLGMALFGHTLIAVAVALFLVHISRGQLPGMRKLLRFGPLCFLGQISYTVYLLHQAVRGSLAVLVFDGRLSIGSLGDFLATLLALAITILLAAATWYAFEARLIRFGHTFHYKKV
jgi:peptidoglycan/LPS O-acetylase OafA/YrhL